MTLSPNDHAAGEAAFANVHALLAIEARLGELVALGALAATPVEVEPADVPEDAEPPRISPEQLANLRDGSIVLDTDGDAWQLADHLWSTAAPGPVPCPWADLARSFGPIRLVYAAA